MGWLILIDPQTAITTQIAHANTWWLGETEGFWVQTGALFLSALGALWIVVSRSLSEKRRATVDLVLHQMGDKELITAIKLVLDLSQNGNLARFASQPTANEYLAIIKVLNTFEFVAGGIRENAYHEGIYKRMRSSTTLKIWESLSGFVQDFRNLRAKQDHVTDLKTLYQDFEWIAERWKKDPLKSTKSTSWKIF